MLYTGATARRDYWDCIETFRLLDSREALSCQISTGERRWEESYGVRPKHALLNASSTERHSGTLPSPMLLTISSSICRINKQLRKVNALANVYKVSHVPKIVYIFIYI